MSEKKAVRGLAKPADKNDTRQRLLDVSADLFNVYGIEAISVSQIAEVAKISPGNLTYHFKKKEDLIHSHVDLLEEQLLDGLMGLPVFSDPRAYSQAYVNLLNLTLKYRFLFLGANYIIGNDLLQKKRYQKLIRVAKRTLVAQTERLISEGYMKPIQDPYSVEMFVDAVWWQWLGWQLSMQVEPPGKWPLEPEIVADAMLHIFFISHDYVDQQFYSAVLAELKEMARKKR